MRLQRLKMRGIIIIKAWLLNVLFLIRIIYLTLIPFISYASCRGYLSLLLLLPGKNSAGPSQIGTLVT